MARPAAGSESAISAARNAAAGWPRLRRCAGGDQPGRLRLRHAFTTTTATSIQMHGGIAFT